MQIVAAYGFVKIFDVTRLRIAYFILSLVLIEALFFGVEYSSYFPYAFSRYSHYGYEELSKRLQIESKSYKRIYISSGVNDAKQYIFYLYFTRYNPFIFQNPMRVEKTIEPDGWVRVARIDNLYFVGSFLTMPIESLLEENDLLFVGAPKEFPGIHIPSVFEIRDKKGDVLFIGIRSQDYRKCLEVSCESS
jgi:hypothetical protein